MKLIRTTLTAIATAAIASAPAYAFHTGGVAECEGCHTMHNTRAGGTKGIVIGRGVGNGAAYLLQGSDQSSTCLNCHNSADTAPSGYHISTDDSMFTQVGADANPANKAPVEMTPGGDFGWLKVTRSFKVRGTPTTVAGEGRGHNIIAADYGYGQSTDTVAPGGTYPASSL